MAACGHDVRAKTEESTLYFDDCAICRAMKRADERGRDLSLNELKDVFAEADKNRPYEQKPEVLGEKKIVERKSV